MTACNGCRRRIIHGDTQSQCAAFLRPFVRVVVFCYRVMPYPITPTTIHPNHHHPKKTAIRCKFFAFSVCIMSIIPLHSIYRVNKQGKKSCHIISSTAKHTKNSTLVTLLSYCWQSHNLPTLFLISYHRGNHDQTRINRRYLLCGFHAGLASYVAG